MISALIDAVSALRYNLCDVSLLFCCAVVDEAQGPTMVCLGAAPSTALNIRRSTWYTCWRRPQRWGRWTFRGREARCLINSEDRGLSNTSRPDNLLIHLLTKSSSKLYSTVVASDFARVWGELLPQRIPYFRGNYLIINASNQHTYNSSILAEP